MRTDRRYPDRVPREGHHISIKNLLKEKGIPEHQNFWWKRKYNKPEVPERFLPVAGGGLPAAMAAQLPGTIQTSPANKNTSIYATTEQNNQFSVSRNIDENHIIPSNTIR